MMATVSHAISGLGLRKFQADGFLLIRMYFEGSCYTTFSALHASMWVARQDMRLCFSGFS